MAIHVDFPFLALKVPLPGQSANTRSLPCGFIRASDLAEPRENPNQLEGLT